jgi:thymidine phosphorylase
VTAIDAYAVGEALVALGGGRRRADDRIDPAVGIVLERKVGDPVREGEPLAVVHASASPAPGGIVERLAGAIEIGDAAPPPAELVRARLA